MTDFEWYDEMADIWRRGYLIGFTRGGTSVVGVLYENKDDNDTINGVCVVPNLKTRPIE